MLLDDVQTIWKPQHRADGSRGPQFALLTCPYDEIFFGGSRGGGKGGPLDSTVMTPYGWRKMGDLRVGQAICNPDGSVSEIIGIYELGERQLYRVAFHDGTSTEVTDDHVWLAWRASKFAKRNGERITGEASARLWTTAQMIEKISSKRRFLIPVTQPVAITDAARYPRRPIPPYLLGALLGDGSLRDGCIRFTKSDHEIPDRINAILEAIGCQERLTGPFEHQGRCQYWAISSCGIIAGHLRKFGLLGKLAAEKFIPEPYLLGTVEERWDLLRGMLDTDGWTEGDGAVYYGTSSPMLRDGVADLARSLGGVVTVSEREPKYTYKGETLQGQTAWTLRIKLRDPAMAFHLPRKKVRCTMSPQSMNRAIVSIEPSRVAPARCIQVSHSNGLYLTNDYIVTHNTSGMLGHWMAHSQKYGSKARGVFFRRRFKQLEEVQRQCNELFPRIGATYTKSSATWTMPGGATLRLRHLWDAEAASEYQGWSLTAIYMEEITNWPTLEPMNRMRGTLRSSDGVRCVMLATGNPGGPGHNVVRQRYIDPAPGGYVPIVDPESGSTRVFIPSRLEDNLALMRNDPGYERRLMSLGNPQLVKAWRYGDWNVTFGGAFDDIWRPDRHVIKPFAFPAGFSFRRSFDWGSAAPSCLQMWAISDGTPIRELGGYVFPRGSMILFGEWYTVARGANGIVKPNVGLRLTNQALGRGIAERSIGRQWSGCVADPSIFAQPGRESIHADMAKGAREIGQALSFAPANNDRVMGWQRMRDMLEAAAADVPEKRGLWVFEICVHFLRTVPTLQRDESRPDDIDTDQEDHCGDSARYACVSGGNKPGIGRAVW